MAIIGIDLGTSNSLVGYYDGEKACLIPNVFGDNLTPSVISIDDNGDILTGKIAKQRLVSHPLQTFSVFKRNMGTNKKYKFEDSTFSCSDLSSLVLKQLKQDAEAYLNESCDQAIISVPAYFNNRQRQATLDAAKLAGLDVIKLINEPTAAALAHGINEFVDDSIIIVLDLGGGTFDVSILEMFDGVLQVLAIAGDNMLGGEDFTQVLVDDFLEVNSLSLEDVSKQDYSIIYDYCEMIKLGITEGNPQQFNINIGAKTYQYKMDSERFSEISKSLLIRMRIPILKALNDSEITINDINQVILMGGSTKLELIRNYTRNLFNTKPRYDINPDQTVGIGAILSIPLHLKDESMEDMIMTDVCGFTLGISIASKLANGGYDFGVFSPIINRNASLPTSRVEYYSTISEEAKSGKIDVYQGEGAYVKDNLFLGKLDFKLPRKGKDQPFEVRFTYDLSGILEVEAKILETNEVFKMVIKDDGCTMSEEEVNNRLNELTNLKEHPRDKQQNRLLIARLEKLYEFVPNNEKELIHETLVNFKLVLNDQDSIKINKASKEIIVMMEDMEDRLNKVFKVKNNIHLN